MRVSSAGPDPIAICGIGLRLPGGICHTQDYWELLVNGRDAKTQGNQERYNPEGFDDTLGGHLSIRNQNGYFLQQDLGRFDPSFFSLSRKEAERCDPQQRLLLEVARECLEDAGEIKYRGRNIGCYVGSFGSTWMRLQTVDSQFPTNYLMTGVEDYMLSNRISYEYDLAGPSMTINTACSASLVALAEACAALQNGTIEGAVVAGGCLQLSPVLTEMMATEGTLSSDGSCKSFDDSANGFARAEGITAIYIKRLDDAIRDGNAIRSIIRGCQSNSDGSRAGLMQPQARTQEFLMRQVYAQAHLNPAETAFVECHGTGTAVGDPIETRAVDNIFGEHGVYIGSVKPNIGHCEGSAGLASLIKGVLALEHGIIPPNIKLRNANPKIPLGHRLQIPLVPTPFPSSKQRRVSVNSFGIGGSNAHVVIESFAPPRVNGFHQDQLHEVNTSLLLLLSANTKHSLDRQVELHHEYASRHPEDLPGMAYTRALRREWLPHRTFTIMDSTGHAITTSTAAKAPGPSSIIKPVMIFSGQGSQWTGMGKELVVACPAFQADLAAMDRILQRLEQPPAWSLCELMSRPEYAADASNILSFDAAELSQPLCTALQIALVHHFRRFGVLPAAVVGHSSGEIAAAYTAGHISLQMAIRSAYYRGLVTKRAQSLNGGMAAVGLGSEDVSRYLVDGVVVACENSPSSSTISGELPLVKRVLASIKAEQPGTLAKLLKVNMAYHSPHMLSLGKEYSGFLRQPLDSEDAIFFSPGAVFISSVTGSEAEAKSVNSPEYWVENLTQRVRFDTAIRNMHAIMGHSTTLVMLEIGPHSTLKGPLRQIQEPGRTLNYVASQKRSEDCHVSMLEALGHLYQFGVEVDFKALFTSRRALAGLPAYPWDHTGPTFWHEGRISRASRFRKYPRHCLLGLRSLESPDSLPIWRNVLDVDEVQWLLDHRVGGNTVFPFAGYIAVAIEALRQTKGLPMGSGYRLRHIVASTALVLAQSKPVELVTSLRQGRLTDSDKSQWFHFQIQSHDGEQWTEHCAGEIIHPMAYSNYEGIYSGHFPRHIADSMFYRAMSHIGLAYGPEFALLRDIKSSVTEKAAQARIVAWNTNTANRYFRIHPAVLDSCLQLVFVAMTQGLCRRLDQLYVPTLIEDIEIYDETDSDHGSIVAQVTMSQGDYHSCRINGFSNSGRSIFTIRGVHLASVERDGGSEATRLERHGLARLEWYPAFDFADVASGLRPPPINRENLRLEHQLSFLCMLQEMDMVRNVLPAKPHLLLLRNWIEKEIMVALETGNFPLLQNPAQLAQLDKSERQGLIYDLVAALAGGPHAPFAKACQRILDHTPAMYAGEVETIDVLTQGNLLTEVYNQNSFEYGEFVHLLAKSNPKLRILEVGAGTGGTTDFILRYLAQENTFDGSAPPYSLYTFTDVSAGFFTNAKARFSGYSSNIEYRVFDISKSPSEQGLQDREHSYDLIIAANVVHATPYIQKTLSNIRSLLAPEGILLLTEPLPTLKTVNYIFGHFSGWWLGEADGRSGGPLLDVESWDRELRNSGFSGADTVVYGAESPYRQIMTVVSHARTQEAFVDESDKQIALLCADKSNLSDIPAALKADLGRRGWFVQTCDINSDLSLPSPRLWISCIDIEYRDFTTKYFSDEGHFQQLREFLRKLVDKKTLWLMPPTQMGSTSQVHAAEFLGLSRSLRSELNLQIFTLEISPVEALQQPDLIARVFEKIERDENDTQQTLAADMEYAVQHSQVFVPRFRPLTFKSRLSDLSSQEIKINSRRAELRISQRALLDTLFWQELPLVATIPEGHVEIETRAIGLNAFDVFSAKGLIRSEVDTQNLKFGCEGAGIVLRIGPGVTNLHTGDRVMFFTNTGAFATQPVISQELALRIPESMSFEQAATVPVCFGTVLHSLVNVAQVEKGQTVLIHSACGGVGLAAIQVCQMLGAELFLTVGNRRKVSYLMDTFGVPRNRIFSSRDASFVDGVMRETRGVGVDVVLNSLSGELLHESWKCVAEFGCFLELGSRDSRGSGRLDMMPFSRNISYHGIEGIQFTQRPSVWRRLCEMFIRCLDEGRLRHIEPLTVFSVNDVEKAFRFLDDASHIGKVALNVAPDISLNLTPHLKRISFDSSGSYILTGGVGGLGRSIATWMVEHGARHLTFLSRTSGVSDTSKALFSELKSMGCSITAIAGRVDQREDVEAAVEQSKHPVKGVLHLAMVLRDASVMDMSWSQWQEVMMPKVKGSWNLHSVLTQKKQPLDFFFVASSIISVLDATGQANYLAANAVNEAFCRHRHGLGLPASILNICPVDDVGFVAENEHAAQSLHAQGLHAAGERELLQCLELSILQDQVSTHVQDSYSVSQLGPWSFSGQLIMGLHTGQKLDDPKCRVMWRRDRRMGVYHNGTSIDCAGAAAIKEDDMLQTLLSSLTAADVQQKLTSLATVKLFAEEIGNKVNEYLLRSDQAVDMESNLADMGLDSLLSVELGRWFKVVFGVRMTAIDIMASVTLKRLALATAKKLMQKYIKGKPDM